MKVVDEEQSDTQNLIPTSLNYVVNHLLRKSYLVSVRHTARCMTNL